ncbi:hypothetical protein Tco_1472921 [Tanacetum coccineum]
MAEHEARRETMFDEYNHQITHRADELPTTKIRYIVNSSKEATMRITIANDPLNVTMYDKFRLKTLGFSEWLEVQSLASKTKSKSNDLLLQSLKAKFQMYINLVPPPRVEGRKGLVIREPESGLTECKASASNLRRIQVKDIFKEVEDHLNTYSSAGMDISWYVEGIR